MYTHLSRIESFSIPTAKFLVSQSVFQFVAEIQVPLNALFVKTSFLHGKKHCLYVGWVGIWSHGTLCVCVFCAKLCVCTCMDTQRIIYYITY